jgi:hypothetical protein
LWLIKVWFTASTFVVKIATFAKPENDGQKTSLRYAFCPSADLYNSTFLRNFVPKKSETVQIRAPLWLI